MNDAPSNPTGTVYAPATRYSRLVNTLRGNVPTIQSVGILTAALIDRCVDERGATSQNIRRNAELLRDLATYSTCQIKGRFGPLENPCVVANLPRARLVELGVKYGQDAVIFGYRKGGKMLGMGFEWIGTNAWRGRMGNAEATRAMFLEPRSANGRDESPPVNDDGGGRVSLRSRGASFVIPFFDQDEARDEGWRGATVLTYRREDPSAATAQVQAAMAEVFRAQASWHKTQRENRTGHYRYVRRGVLGNRIRDLHRLMGHWRNYPLPWERTW